MQKLYKLTNKNGKTRKNTQWAPGVIHTATGDGGLCTNGVIHAYIHPLVAVFMNPVHAKFREPRIWESMGEVTHKKGHTKCGCKSLAVIKELHLPEITTEQRIEIAIRCAMTVCTNRKWKRWAKGWLSGKDRSGAAADAAGDAALRDSLNSGGITDAYSACFYAAASAADDNNSYAAHAVGAAASVCEGLDLIAIIEQVMGEPDV